MHLQFLLRAYDDIRRMNRTVYALAALASGNVAELVTLASALTSSAMNVTPDLALVAVVGALKGSVVMPDENKVSIQCSCRSHLIQLGELLKLPVAKETEDAAQVTPPVASDAKPNSPATAPATLASMYSHMPLAVQRYRYDSKCAERNQLIAVVDLAHRWLRVEVDSLSKSVCSQADSTYTEVAQTLHKRVVFVDRLSHAVEEVFAAVGTSTVGDDVKARFADERAVMNRMFVEYVDASMAMVGNC